MTELSTPVAVGTRTVVKDKNVNETPRVAVIDGSGIQAIKGGQTVDIPFFDSVITAYSNLSNSPIIAITLLLAVLCALAEYNSSDGPLESIAKTLKSVIDNSANSGIVINIARFILYVDEQLIANKVIAISSLLFWIPYFAKPSEKHMRVSAALTLWVVIKPTDLFADLLLSQLYFLYTQLRNPKVKFMLLVFGISVFVIGMTNINNHINATSSRPGSSVPPSIVSGDIPNPQQVNPEVLRRRNLPDIPPDSFKRDKVLNAPAK